MTEPKDNPITLESLRKQFLENDFTTMSDTLPENMTKDEAELYNKVIEFINVDWQEFAKDMGLKRPQTCYSEHFIPEALRLRVSRIIANAIIKIVGDEKVLDNILTTFVLPQLFAPLVDLVEQIDQTELAGDEAKELLEILKNPAELEDSTIDDECDINNSFFDDETIEELRKEFGDEIADKAKNINLSYNSDDLLKHMVDLLMNTMDVQSLIEIALANPVAEDFNCNNPLNYAKRDFEKAWYHTRTAKTISLDEITEKADLSSGTEISDVVDVEEVVIAAITAEEFLNTLDETDKKIVDMLVKKFTQTEIANEVGLSQSAVSRRLKKISVLGKEFKKTFQTTHKKLSLVSLVYREQNFPSFFGGIFVFEKFFYRRNQMTERKKLEFISSVEIMNTPMKKQRFIVDGMIYPGIHILSGDPKIGKSWMMMDMCLAVAKGEDFLGRTTEQGQVVYMALEDTFISLQSRMYELTDEPSENLTFTLLANSIGSRLEEDLSDCKKMFPDLKLVVIDTLQKIRNNIDTKYGADYQELSVLKSIADQLGIAIVLVHHNRKAHDSNPNNLISGTNGIAGCADGLLVFTRNGENAKLHISGRGAPSLELNLKRENAKWILLDDVPESKPDIFPFMIHDFLIKKISVNGTASEICSILKQEFPQQEFNCNWLFRDLLQHDDEIRALGIDYGKTKRNGIRSIFIHYNADRDSSGSKILCTENSVPADPERVTNADDYLHEVDCVEFTNTENADPAVPVEHMQGETLIAMAAEMMRRNLAKQEIIVPAFSAD